MATGKHDVVRAALRAQGWLPGRDVTVFSDGDVGLQGIVLSATRQPALAEAKEANPDLADTPFLQHAKQAGLQTCSTVFPALGELLTNGTKLATRTSLVVGLFGNDRSASCRENEHEMILEAIKDGDEETASVLVRGHLQHIQEHLDLSRTKREEPDLVSLLWTK